MRDRVTNLLAEINLPQTFFEKVGAILSKILFTGGTFETNTVEIALTIF